MTCYDFPLLVLHGDGGCPRYNGGICHPMPTPVEPYTDEEASAVRAYDEYMEQGFIVGRLIRATGVTQFPAEEGKA